MIQESEKIMYFVTLEQHNNHLLSTVFLHSFIGYCILHYAPAKGPQCPGLNSAHNSDVFNLISLTTFNLSQPMQTPHPIQSIDADELDT